MAKPVPALFVFGDSLVDVGKNNYLPFIIFPAKANFPHNGIDFPTKEATGRFSNGKNAADFLAERLGLPSPPPYLSLVNNNKEIRAKGSLYMAGVSFASGGATIFNDSDQDTRRSIPLKQQVSYYLTVYQNLVKTLGQTAAQNHISKSLFSIVIGSNDILNYFGSSNLREKYTPKQYIKLIINTLKSQLQVIHANHARKFLVTGLGVLGCIPSIRVKSETWECNSELNNWTVKYNTYLKKMLTEFKSKHKEMAYSYFQTYGVMENVIANPTTYGFAEVKEECCGIRIFRYLFPCTPLAICCPNRREYVFWDLYHPTEAIAHILVDTLYDGPSKYCIPYNVGQLLEM